jgi:hypothetical protein
MSSGKLCGKHKIIGVFPPTYDSQFEQTADEYLQFKEEVPQ